MCYRLFLARLEEFTDFAHMVTSDGIGVELLNFQISESSPENNFEYWKKWSIPF